MGEIRVILFGVGRVGSDLARLLNARPGFRVVGAYTRNPRFDGKELFGVQITTNRQNVLRVSADIAVIATTSFLRDVVEDIRAAVQAGLNVICTGEEMLLPWIVDRSLADDLDKLARERKVSILGAGANPGFIFDALVLTAAGAAWNVESIHGRRVVNCSHFSATILRRLGFGYPAEEFKSGALAGRIYGHIGFPQSISLVAESIGVKIEKIEKGLEPFIAEKPYRMDHLTVQPGQSVGFLQKAVGYVDGRPWYVADFIGHADPLSAGFELKDSIDIEGYAPIHLAVSPGFNPHLTSAAILANSLRRIKDARPGLVTVADLPPAFPSVTLRERFD
jgi:4-hydroxy-tetrahydrodipicolinate reductase